MSSKNLLQGLNASQQEAVATIDGPLLILAGPGSGKTRVITHRIAYMIEQGIDSAEILGLTFTNKAAGEMRQRLDRLVGPNQVWLGTFHGFCVRLLRRYARLVGLPENFSIYDVDDSLACLKQAATEAQFEFTHTPLSSLAQRISFFKNRLITPEILESEALSNNEYQVAKVYPYYQRALLSNGAVDFDDLLMHTATFLRQYPELREQLDRRFRYVMVDEYQDTNLAQYVILRHLCVDNRNLAATGDPDQSIYGWRGANPKNISSLERDYSDLHVIRLEDNYRSTPEILSVADFLIQHNDYRKHKKLVPSRPGGPKVRLVIYPTAREEADDIADQILALTSQGEHQLSDFGILYRTNAQSRLLEQAMLRRQLPYQLIGGFRFYLRREIKDLVAYLQLVFNPQDDVSLQRIINVPPRGIGKQTLAKIGQIASARNQSMLEAVRIVVEQKTLGPRPTAALREFLELHDQLSRQSANSLLELLQLTLEKTNYREYLANQKGTDFDSAELLQNIDELLADAQELDNDQSDDRPAIERFLESVALQADTDRLALGQAKVTLMTLHAAKGLEFSSVYITAVEENILPHSRSKDDPMQLEEERRLLFVGITRAQDRLQLSYAKSRGFGGSSGSGVPSSFLMELPKQELQIIDHTDRMPSGDHYGNGAGFEDYFDSGSANYDETSQVSDDDDYVHEDFDELSQLPADESLQRRMKKAKQVSRGKISMGSQLAAGQKPWERFRKGVLVNHPDLGSGEIISTTGHGPKRSVTVYFFDSHKEVTYRLSHAPLELQ
ncbi:MAG: UvrD-helicase domain-containing protein [Pirellulales bacterium]